MKQFNSSVVCEFVLSEEIKVNKIWHVVEKVSLRDCRVTLGLCRFNAASLPTDLSQLTKVMSHCVERNSDNAFATFKR